MGCSCEEPLEQLQELSLRCEVAPHEFAELGKG